MTMMMVKVAMVVMAVMLVEMVVVTMVIMAMIPSCDNEDRSPFSQGILFRNA